MTDDTPMPDYEEDPSRDNPLWDNRFGDLGNIENFTALAEEYGREVSLSLQMEGLLSNDTNSSDITAAIVEEMRRNPLHAQAYNFHYDRGNYRPQLIPPAVQVEVASPPRSPSPTGRPETASAAALDPGNLSASNPNRQPGAGSEPQSRPRTTADASRNSGDQMRKSRK